MASDEQLLRLHRARSTPRYASLVMHWFARLFRRPRRVHREPCPGVGADEVAVMFGGHATALIRYSDAVIACDPMLGNWVKFVHREQQAGLTRADLREVDLVLISHTHADHLHLPTLDAMSRAATIVVPPQGARAIGQFGFARVVELQAGASLIHRSVRVTATPAVHGDRPVLSYVVHGAGPSVFFCGESGYFPGFASIGNRYQPDIALLPIGGYAPRSFRRDHMSPIDALAAFDDLRARVMIPIHHGAFALSYERLSDPERWLAQLIADRQLSDYVLILPPGAGRVFVGPQAAGQLSRFGTSAASHDGELAVDDSEPPLGTARAAL